MARPALDDDTPDMPYRTIPVTPFQQNCSILWCEHTRRSLIIDPGGDIMRIQEALAATDTIAQRILLTHGHLDHVGGAAELAAQHGIPIDGPGEADRYWLEALEQQSRMFGMPATRAFTPDRWLVDGDRIELGTLRIEVLHCPGHTPGHLVFFVADEALAFVGDVLFHGSIGRTDFPGGDHAALLSSIRSKLWPLGDGIRFVPGHGPESTFGEERASNPFVSDRYG